MEDGPSRRNTDLMERNSPPLEHDISHKSIVEQLRTLIMLSKINFLLPFVLAGIVVKYTVDNSIVVFVINFIAIIPLASLVSFITEDIGLCCGELQGGLINASFGNVVELIVSIIALTKHEIVIVKTSLLVSILSNLLLVLSMSFTIGGYNHNEQHFNKTMAQCSPTVIEVPILMMIIPTASQFVFPDSVAPISRSVSIIDLFLYATYILFQLKTHREKFSQPSRKSPTNAERQNLTPANQLLNTSEQPSMDESTEPKPELSAWFAVIMLIVTTVLVALCCEYLVSSINDFVISTGISRIFVGLIVIPFVGNVVEHFAAVTAARRDKMDMSIGIAVGSVQQIALLVTPFTVILGWALGIDMTLCFEPLLLMRLVVAVFIVTWVLIDGKSNYLEGNFLICLFLSIVAAAALGAIGIDE